MGEEINHLLSFLTGSSPSARTGQNGTMRYFQNSRNLLPRGNENASRLARSVDVLAVSSMICDYLSWYTAGGNSEFLYSSGLPWWPGPGTSTESPSTLVIGRMFGMIHPRNQSTPPIVSPIVGLSEQPTRDAVQRQTRPSSCPPIHLLPPFQVRPVPPQKSSIKWSAKQLNSKSEFPQLVFAVQ